MKRTEIKKIGKISVRGKRKKAVFIGLFSLIFCVVITLIIYGFVRLSQGFADSAVDDSGDIAVFAVTAVILTVLSVTALCVYSSASVGEKAWYCGLTSSKRNCGGRFFFWFKPRLSLRALAFKALLTVLKTTEALLFLLPGLIVLQAVFYLAQSGGVEIYLFASLFGGAVLLILCGLGFAFVSAQRYFLAEYIFLSTPQISASDAIRQSKNLLDGHIGEIVRFKLSFIPWFIGCLLVFPTIYFVPYYKASCSLVAKRIVL